MTQNKDKSGKAPAPPGLPKTTTQTQATATVLRDHAQLLKRLGDK